MATHCIIGYETLDGGYRGMYCHWDGWPDHIGPILEKMWHADVAILVEQALTEDGIVHLNSTLPGESPILYRQHPSIPPTPARTLWPCHVYEWGYRKRLDGSVEVADGNTLTVVTWQDMGCSTR